MLYLPDRPAFETPAPQMRRRGSGSTEAGRAEQPCWCLMAAALKSGGFTVICERNQIYPNNLKINK